MGRQSTRQAQKRREAKRHRRNPSARARARDQVVAAGSRDTHWRFDAEAGSGLTNRIFEIAATWLEPLDAVAAPNARLVHTERG